MPAAQRGERVRLKWTVIARAVTTAGHGPHACRPVQPTGSGSRPPRLVTAYWLRLLCPRLRETGPAWPELRSAPPIGVPAAVAVTRRGQVEAMNLLMAAATLAGCSSATQCPLSVMMLVALSAERHTHAPSDVHGQFRYARAKEAPGLVAVVATLSKGYDLAGQRGSAEPHCVTVAGCRISRPTGQRPEAASPGLPPCSRPAQARPRAVNGTFIPG